MQHYKNKYSEIHQFLRKHPLSSRAEISEGLGTSVSPATMKRLLAQEVDMGRINVEGRGNATKYSLSPQGFINTPIDIEEYFASEQDKRDILTSYNFSLIPDILPKVEIFNEDENNLLEKADSSFRERISHLPPALYRKEMERLGIDLSWKSSQIEGNTYSLLETERLLREKMTAAGKTKEEAVMLLNHKDALQFMLDEPDYLQELSIGRVQNIHAILTKELDVHSGLRYRRVGITGTNYQPLDNEFQIRESLDNTCSLINSRSNAFEKALLALILLSYIQPFDDGNKRTARLVANGILMAHGGCPISFRTVESIDYKKAILLFYEQNNISAFKEIFLEQYLFAVKNYF